jgi:hypothetical protein
MPRDTPRANIIECEQTGANVTLVDGLITDCGKIVAERKDAEGWFDVSTLKEPYRVEGKKTMGYELAEQFDWTLPDVILYPTGGGTGLIGMWKAFDEMEAMGWIDSKDREWFPFNQSAARRLSKRFTKAKLSPPNFRTRNGRVGFASSESNRRFFDSRRAAQSNGELQSPSRRRINRRRQRNRRGGRFILRSRRRGLSARFAKND